MAKLTGAHLVMRCLKLEGIQRIFTIVGDTILPLCDAAVDEGIQLIDTRHEAAAMGMADAWCRITGEPAVAMVTGGPGFANAISGLPNIYTSESPVIFIAGSSELPEQGHVLLPGDRPDRHDSPRHQGLLACASSPPHTGPRRLRLPHRAIRPARPGAPYHTHRYPGTACLPG